MHIIVRRRRLYAVMQMLLFYNHCRQHLSTNHYETLTHDMYLSAIEHYEEIFGYWPLTKFGAPKLPIFDDLATQWQFNGQYLQRRT